MATAPISPACARARVTDAAPRIAVCRNDKHRAAVMRLLIVLMLSVALCWSSGSLAAAEKNPPARISGTAAFAGLGVEDYALAAIAGAGLGAAAAAVSGNAVGGLTLGTLSGTLAALYVAHLLVEAVVVGGVYYFWPWESQRQKSARPLGKAIRDVPAPRPALGLRLATQR